MMLIDEWKMRCNKIKTNLRSRKLIGTCFSIEENQLEQEQRQLSCEEDKGHETNVSPKKPSPGSCRLQNQSSVASITKNVSDLRLSSRYQNVTIFTYGEMELATKQFRPDFILGEGGFGVVYKGIIDDNVRPGFKATNVAIKVLNRYGLQGDTEWLTEVNFLGQLVHPNLVKLIGYCCEDDHRVLVYEYMSNGSLEKHIFSRVRRTLNWSSRIRIALHAAQGLAFLHGAERPVIYRDFKTSNILLDVDFNAKLSDFGLAKDGPVGDKTHVSTRVMGTYGYAAPEYVMTGHLTARSDVYGFGVVLLELLIGKRALDKGRPSREHNLVEWARPLLTRDCKFLRIIDPKLEGQFHREDAMEMAKLAYQCLSQNPKGRPLMNRAVEILNALQSRVAAYHDNKDAATFQEIPRPMRPTLASTERRVISARSNFEDRCKGSCDKQRHRSEPPVGCYVHASAPNTTI